MAGSNRELAARAAVLARKAVNQWLDAPDGREARPAFVVGCQRSGTTMLMDVFERMPDVWVHREKSTLAYEDYRLRSPATVDLVTRMTPASVAVFKPVCDSHLTDRILAAHPQGRALWVVRGWSDVARSAVRKWGDHQRDVILQITHGQGARTGWRGERLPPALVEQLREVSVGGLSDVAGAALFWYVRNTFFFSLGLDTHPRVRLVRYEELVSSPTTTFPRVAAHLGLPWEDRFAEGLSERGGGEPVEVPADIAALCEALSDRFLAHALSRA